MEYNNNLMKALELLKAWERDQTEERKPTSSAPKYKDARIRNSGIPSWGRIKKDILKRDEAKCRICDKDYSLHIHHIDYNRQNNAHNNLVTLCEWCHRHIHLENYKPCNYPDYPTPWDKNSYDEYDEMNQDFNCYSFNV